VLDLPEYDAARQRAEMAPFGRGQDYKDVDSWLQGARPNDTLLLASFRVLAMSTGRKQRQGRTEALREQIARAVKRAPVLEAVSGVCSDEKRLWAKIVRRALNFERAGGHMTGETARQRSKKGAKKGGEAMKALSAEYRWAREPELFAACLDVWRSRSYSGDEARLAAVNAHIERSGRPGMMIGSTSTARRLFRNVIKRD